MPSQSPENHNGLLSTPKWWKLGSAFVSSDLTALILIFWGVIFKEVLSKQNYIFILDQPCSEMLEGTVLFFLYTCNIKDLQVFFISYFCYPPTLNIPTILGFLIASCSNQWTDLEIWNLVWIFTIIKVSRHSLLSFKITDTMLPEVQR